MTRPLLMLDYDGVVVDSFEIFSAALIAACRRAGVPSVSADGDVLALFEGNVYERLRATGAAPAQVHQALADATRGLRVALPAMRPFPLIPQVLAELGEARHLAIVTSNAGDVVEAFLRRYGITAVAEIAGAEAGEGKVAKIEAMVARFPGQARYWYVGDTAGDMREARRAGATPLGVAWGWHDPELLAAAGAERIAATPADLLAIVAPELTADFLGGGLR